MRLIYRLPVIALIFGLLLLGGCSSGDNSQLADEPIKTACLAVEDPAPPTPFDEASRLVSVQAEIQRLQCECAVQAGTYACAADCEADLFKLEPNGNAQCLRDLFAANPLEAPMLDCNLNELEGLASCMATASCNEDASLACLAGLEDRLNVCPTGPGSLGDSFGFDVSDPVDTAFLGIPELSFPAAQAVFTDQNFYPGTSILPVVKLPTFTSTDVASLAGGTLTDVPGALNIEYNFNITSFTVAVDPIQTFLLNYTATGTLTEVPGSTPAGFDGATLSISVTKDSQASPDATDTGPGFKQTQWLVNDVDAEYTITLPNSTELIFNTPTRLLAYDSFFDAALDSCLDLPGDQLATLYGESLDAAFDQVCRCVADDTERTQCLLGKQSPRMDCLAQAVAIDPIATEVTECLVELLDEETDIMATQACCVNPGDFDCLNPDPFSGSLGGGLDAGRCVPSVEARDLADAILSCMGPEPPPPVVFSDDPARCELNDPNILVSGQTGDFMVVSRSQKVDPITGNFYKRDYLVMNLSKLSLLATIPVDAVQEFLFSLYLLDADPSKDAKDQCELAGIVSIGLDYSGAPPEYLQAADLIRDVQAGLGGLQSKIDEGKAQAEAFAEELYVGFVCPAFQGVVDSNQAANSGGGKSAIAKLIFKKLLLSAIGC